MSSVLALILAGHFLSGILVAQGTGMKAISLCEIFDDPRPYDGRIVALRGVYYQDWHGASLNARDCQTRLVTGELVWPAAIDVEPVEYAISKGLRIPFEPDVLTIRQIEERVRETRKRDPSVEAWVTVLGMLRTRSEYAVERLPSGLLHGNGFGALDQYPGQIIVQTIKDLSFEKKTDKK